MTALASASFSRRSPAAHCAGYALAVQSPTPSASSPTARQVVTARGRWYPCDTTSTRSTPKMRAARVHES